MTDTGPALSPRKEPRQERSRRTVEAILEAAARVLVQEGYDKASTNRVAKVAGVSVGSLYQYFSSKEALVLALVRQHQGEMLSLLHESMSSLEGAPLADAVRTFVQGMLAAHRLDPGLHRALVQQVLHLGLAHIEELENRSCAVVRIYLEQHKHEILPRNLDMAAKVLVTCVESITHRAAFEEGGFSDPALEEELVSLILRYLVGEVPARAPAGAR